ncbi:hypothetical protein KIN20_038329 [Parelaphostrongylus tenuis]|uniref:Uncharacterized protein n=1 Tax=Parelaphostrongylus tenuis TaxID=148309 RepID=A0AAD5RFF5_PARTN|nr:hypothetical protein KIN20_038329 [Parelaphostrongylus tenuis]
MRGIAMYSSNTDDPYVTLHVDSDEEEKEEIEVKSDDNMVVLAKIDKLTLDEPHRAGVLFLLGTVYFKILAFLFVSLLWEKFFWQVCEAKIVVE